MPTVLTVHYYNMTTASMLELLKSQVYFHLHSVVWTLEAIQYQLNSVSDMSTPILMCQFFAQSFASPHYTTDLPRLSSSLITSLQHVVYQVQFNKEIFIKQSPVCYKLEIIQAA